MSVTWTFQNALFEDGTSLTGSFDYNSNRVGPFGYSNVNVQTQNGSGLLAQTYTGVKLLSGALGFTAENGSQTLGILFDEWIGFGGNPGGSVAVGGGEKLEGVVGTKPIMFFGRKIGERDVYGVIASRELVSGAITTGAAELAEPATLAMFALGLAALVTLRRKAII